MSKDFGNFKKEKITGGGYIQAAGREKANFGLDAQYPGDKDTAKGSVEYQDKDAKLKIKSIVI